MDRKWPVIIFIALGTAILGEVKIQPFGSAFRFGLGSLFFMLSIIYWYGLPVRLIGVVVSIVTVAWRVSLSVSKGKLLWLGLMAHLPAAAYYLTMAFFLANVHWWDRRERPLQVGAIMALADGAANLVEMVVRSGFDLTYISPERIWFIVVVAASRGLVVVLLANIILQERFRATKVVEEEQMAERLLVGSNLHMEAFYLRKSMVNIETVMVRSHELYQKIKETLPGSNSLSAMALDVAKEIHEVKKDIRRAEEELNQLVADVPAVDIMDLKEILELVAGANGSFAQGVGKDIQINVLVEGHYVTDRIYPLVSILNNLVQNAVEAIEQQGKIDLIARVGKDMVTINIQDDGPGIAGEDRDLIFEPGFTNKFDSAGRPSTGIGLTHVRDMVEYLGGSIKLEATHGKGAFFSLQMPLKPEVNKDGQ